MVRLVRSAVSAVSAVVGRASSAEVQLVGEEILLRDGVCVSRRQLDRSDKKKLSLLMLVCFCGLSLRKNIFKLYT